MGKKLNERQVRHLVEVLKESEFYFGDRSKGGKIKMDRKFFEAIQLFFLSPKGKDVQKVINAFKTVAPECFVKVVPKNCKTVTQGVKDAVLSVLERNLSPKKNKEARRLLVYKDCNSSPTPFRDGKGEVIAFLEEDVIKKHPQLVS